MSAVLSVRDLRLKRAAREILKGVSFEVVRGEVVALMGLSGSGKTTILRAVADLEPEGRTAVQVAGSESGNSSPRSGARVGMVFQFHFLFEHLSVLDNICLAPVRVHGVTRTDAATRAMQWLTQLGIAHRAAALPRELSGGEAQRAAIARAVAMDPPVLLLDEPTASLDPPRRTSLGVLLNELAAQGRALLVTSHDVDFVRDHATRVLILADGLLVEQGPPRVVFSAPQHEATRSLLQSTVPSAVPTRP